MRRTNCAELRGNCARARRAPSGSVVTILKAQRPNSRRLSAPSEQRRMPHLQMYTLPHDFMCIVRSSLTTKRFLLHLVHANGLSPWKWRRRKCFFAWYLVANSLPQSWHLTGAAEAESVVSTSGWRGRWVVMWKMRFISRLKTLRQTVHVKVKACCLVPPAPPEPPAAPVEPRSSCRCLVEPRGRDLDKTPEQPIFQEARVR